MLGKKHIKNTLHALSRWLSIISRHHIHHGGLDEAWSLQKGHVHHFSIEDAQLVLHCEAPGGFAAHDLPSEETLTNHGTNMTKP